MEGYYDGLILLETMGNNAWYIIPVSRTFQGFFFFLKIDRGE